MRFFVHRHCRIFLLCFLFLALPRPGCAQSVPTDDPSKNQTYKLEGTVTNSVTGEPVPHALVTLSAEGKSAMLTGMDGSFRFSGLPAGPVMIIASKPGFFAQSASQPRMTFLRYASARTLQSLSTGMSVQIGPDMSSINLKLAPEGVITGHVEDAHGEPVEGAGIKIESARLIDGRKVWDQTQGISTDEEGNFRVGNLIQGRYYVSVRATARGRTLEDLTQTVQMGFPAVMYYPAGPDRASAAPIEVAAGQRIELQFALKSVQVFRVSGDVSGLDSKQGVNLRLLSSAGDELSLPVRFDSTTGKFQIERVPAGVYRLDARGMGHAEIPVNVASNVSDLHLYVSPKTAIPVIVRSESGGNSPAMAEEINRPSLSGVQRSPPVSLYLRSSGPEGMTVYGSLEQAGDGSNVLNAPPGRYSLDLHAMNGSYIQSARCGDTDLLREDLVIQPGVPSRPIEIVLRDDAATLMFTVSSDATNAPKAVVVMPEAAPSQILMVNFFGRGETTVSGLAPGEYKLFAFDAPDQIEWRNPEVLSQYSSKAAQVTLSARGRSSVSVEVIHTGAGQ